MPKTIKETNERSFLSWLFYGSWETMDDFDEELDAMAEYQMAVNEDIDAYYSELAFA